MRKGYLVLLLAVFWSVPAAAQQESIQATYDGVESTPAAKIFKTGCGLAVVFPGQDIDISVEFWNDDGSYDAMHFFGIGFVIDRFNVEVPATINTMNIFCRMLITYSGLGYVHHVNDSNQIPGLAPTDLQRAPGVADTFTFNAPGDYLLSRVWQVYDRQGPWTFANQSVTETVAADPGANSCNLSFATGTATTNSQGRFTDKYGNTTGSQTIPACVPLPSCSTSAWQTITVAGVDFSHVLQFTCQEVTIHGR